MKPMFSRTEQQRASNEMNYKFTLAQHPACEEFYCREVEPIQRLVILLDIYPISVNFNQNNQKKCKSGHIIVKSMKTMIQRKYSYFLIFCDFLFDYLEVYYKFSKILMFSSYFLISFKSDSIVNKEIFKASKE